MFGIDDPGVWLAYLGVFLSVGFGVFYGIKNWNKGDNIDLDNLDEDMKWEENDQKIKDDIAD